jgi:hypothetical protein
MALPLTTSHLFPRLPKELRLQIWNHAICEPRTVAIQNKWTTSRTAGLYTARRNPPPATLQANQESRSQALTIYTTAFRNGVEPRYTYVNFDIDTIFVTDWDLKEIESKDRAKIRKLSVEVGGEFIFLGYVLVDEMKEMWRLKELEIVAVDGHYPWVTGEGIESDLVLVREEFEKLFGGKEGWVFPKLRLFRSEIRGSGIEWFLFLARSKDKSVCSVPLLPPVSHFIFHAAESNMNTAKRVESVSKYEFPR